MKGKKSYARKAIATILTLAFLLTLFPVGMMAKETQAPPSEITGSYVSDGDTFTYTVKELPNAEYKMDAAKSWESSNVFEGIEPGSTHTFFVRYKETETHEASKAIESDPIVFSKLDNTKALDLNYSVYGNSGNRTIEIEKVDGCEYSFDGGNTWSSADKANILTGINNKVIAAAIRYKETATMNASAKVQKYIDTAVKTQSAPDDFTLEFDWNKDGETLTATIPRVSGCEYSFDGINWSQTNTKTNCEPNTYYTGYIRYKADSTHQASAATSDTRRSPKLSDYYEYDITVDKNNGGFVSIIPSEAEPGERVTIQISANYGYELDSLLVLKNGYMKLDTNKVTNKTYTFVMPSADVTVRVRFAEKELPLPPDPEQGDIPFTDVNKSSWYYPSVKYCYDNDIMHGISGKLFFPNVVTTRGMVVSVLYNMENSSKHYYQAFWDVAPNTWYYDAVNWASANHIVAGFGNGRFGPEELVTREQLVSILLNYAKYKGYDTSRTMDLSNYRDAKSISSWALDSMEWAVASDVISGVGYHRLQPQGPATRAQLATIMMNFDIAVANN